MEWIYQSKIESLFCQGFRGPDSYFGINFILKRELIIFKIISKLPPCAVFRHAKSISELKVKLFIPINIKTEI